MRHVRPVRPGPAVSPPAVNAPVNVVPPSPRPGEPPRRVINPQAVQQSPYPRPDDSGAWWLLTMTAVLLPAVIAAVVSSGFVGRRR
ncbi:hypothetical protein HEP84_11405 [Streptomyces sp. RLB1-33]|uniref:hypothetical protein n=1 Tax=Streptomyces mirabilis TaxID=68239 RepID=UPI00143EBC2A|nr:MULTISPECIES: hypothetical protein [Streptomyces]QIY69677.1 hypothetical protein HEP84_11405 [Streptomyces sp. RLB1-33]QUW83469.1 hypothetical protein SMIR_33505 [Streptomyces mirabilis]